MTKHLVLAAAFATALSAFAAPKYTFLFIGDGMSVCQRMLADEFSVNTGGGHLEMNTMPVAAFTRTRCANRRITDSAAAATAIACGRKTNARFLGLDPDGARLESCAAAAHQAGRKVGIMTTVTITHATPGGFYAHVPDRADAYTIAGQLADSGFEFFAGGGLGTRDDDSPTNRYDYARSRGYTVVTNRGDFAALKPGCGKILTRFTDGCLRSAIDYDPAAGQPELKEIVAKAIELLDNEKGFFIMCEGGLIDWAGHSNDAATNIRETLAFNESVKVALDFQAQHPDDTLVIVTGDHETGGLSLGSAGSGSQLQPELLAAQTMSIGRFNDEVKLLFREKGAEVDYDADIRPLITRAFGLRFGGDAKADPMVLTEKELKTLAVAYEHDVQLIREGVRETDDYMAKLRYTLGSECRTVLAGKCGIGWTTGGHTAMPTHTTASGASSGLFAGYYENTEIGNRLKKLYATEAR